MVPTRACRPFRVAIAKLDDEIAAVNRMPELYECSNCFHRGPLDIHGGCERCHSQAVMSEQVIMPRGLAEVPIEELYAAGAAGA